MLAPNTLLQNRYLIIRSIGQGGMGAVYLAKDQRLSHTVALKETFFNDPRMRRAFEREAKLLASLRHSALPVVSDYFTEGDEAFLVMQYIPGEDLETKLQLRNGPFPQNDVVEWADQLLGALSYLHDQEPPILHRDIKPANLKLTGDGQIVLLDFGLAKGSIGTTSRSSDRSVLGFTPNFAPLEQIQGTGTNKQSDLYSLAATIYCLLTGQIPADAVARASALVYGQPDPLRPADEVNPQVMPGVARLLLRALALKRDERPASAAEMRRELRDAREGRAERETDSSSSPSAQLNASISPHPITSSEMEKLSTTEILSHNIADDQQPVAGLETTKAIEKSIESLPPTVEAELSPTVGKALQSTVASARETHALSASSTSVKVTPDTNTSPTAPVPLSFAGADSTSSDSAVSSRGKTLLLSGAVVLSLIVALALGASWAMRSDDEVSGKRVSQESQPAIRSNNQPHQITSTTESEHQQGFTNSIGMEFVWIPSGSFNMGAGDGETNERPVHQVTIANGFYMSRYEVTQGQWQAVMGTNPSQFSECGSNCPVERVSWYDTQEFLNRLNALNDNNYQYRLPSEAEWEYACRAATAADHTGELNSVAWYEGNSGARTNPVGMKQPNAFGLHDMHGNVWEWCLDYYHDSYNGAPTDGSAWTSGGDSNARILRGGSWINYAGTIRSANRFWVRPTSRLGSIGLRVIAVTRQ